MVTKATGRPRGRPKISLSDDPNRYLMTWFEAMCQLSDNYKAYDENYMSRRNFSLTLMAWLHGSFEETEEKWKNLREQNPVVFRTERTVGGFVKDPRYPTYFHVEAESFCRKVRKFHGMKEFTEDGRLWHSLVQAWLGTIMPIPSDKTDFASLIIQARCESVGETSFYHRVLSPWFDAKVNGLPIPSFTLPDFFPQDGA